MRNIGLSNLFSWRPTVVDQEIEGTKKVRASSPVAGGVATARTRSAKVDLPTGLVSNDEAKARIEVMLALAKSGHFNAYASVLKSQTAKIKNTSNRAKVYSDQMANLIGCLNDMQDGKSASMLRSTAASKPNQAKDTANIWAATIANYTANAAPTALLGSDQKMQGTQSDIVQFLTAAGMQDDVANDVAAALACSTHLAATMTVADPADSETVRTIPHDPTACASKIVDSMVDRLPAKLQGSLDAERSKVVTVLANLHDEVHTEVLSQVAKSNLHDVVTDRVRKLLDQTPQIADTTAEPEREARQEAQRVADERRHDRVNDQELATAKQDRARSVT